jgi:hypothetical protein
VDRLNRVVNRAVAALDETPKLRRALGREINAPFLCEGRTKESNLIVVRRSQRVGVCLSRHADGSWRLINKSWTH